MFSSEHSPEPQPDPQKRQEREATTIEIARSAMEQWTLARWAAEGGSILHSVRNALMAGCGHASGFMRAMETERSTYESLRSELLPLIRDGIDLQESLADSNLEELPASTRTLYLYRLEQLQMELVPVIERLGECQERVVKEWWNDLEKYGDSGNVRLLAENPGESDWLKVVRSETENLIRVFSFLRTVDNHKPENIDIVKAAQSALSGAIHWKGNPEDLVLPASLPRPELSYVLKNLQRVIDEKCREVSEQEIVELFALAAEDEGFADTFKSYHARIFELLVHRAELTATVHDMNQLSIAIEISAETVSTWEAIIPQFKQSLLLASNVAQSIGLDIEVEVSTYPPTLLVDLTVDDLNVSAVGDFATQYKQQPILVRQSYTDSMSFPIRMANQNGSRTIRVSTQRTPLMEAERFLEFRDTLNDISNFLGKSGKNYTGVDCKANCSITMNEDSFDKRYFEVSLTGPAEVERRSYTSERFNELYTFSWEEKPTPPLDFYDRYNARKAPTRDAVLLPSNALANEALLDALVSVESRFKYVDLQLGIQALYAPEERPEVIELFLTQLTEKLPSDLPKDCTLRCKSGLSSEASIQNFIIFHVEIFSAEGEPIQVGAFPTTTLDLGLRPHSHDIERKALESLQSLMTEIKSIEELDAAFDASTLSIADHSGEYIRSLIAGRFAGGIMSMVAQSPIAGMIMTLREPWVNTKQAADGSIHIDAPGFPPLPSQEIVYGERLRFGGSGQPITTFREALLLHAIQEQEMNNGFKFEPSDAFFERRDANPALPLTVDSE